MGEASRSTQLGDRTTRGNQSSSFNKTNVEYYTAETQQRIETKVLFFRNVFSKNRNDLNSTVKDIEDWLRQNGATIDKRSFEGRDASTIAFRFGGENFMGKISPEGSIVFSKGGFGRILGVNYGTNHSFENQPTRSKVADAIWQKNSTETWVITSEPVMGDRSGSPTFRRGLEYYSETTTLTQRDLDTGKNFILKRLVPEQVFTGPVSEGLNRIDAPGVLKAFWSTISANQTP